ncbi:MAG: anthranilate synthase component I family protein [Acidimicrobiia bacterium]|nr:anthranilate synthase component I family protein [Acidimicrobiia bacterium]MYC57350.1 anthranilate synthase component I family protein [Acidimicrobiia bacterium]MYG94553.1 anthranilate synthase component I family protein [Acidimicrobiia bacterium]MYI30267.1 anthranilate synthase component I family protein [Acidimicrobiia bacterium]
MQLAAVAVVGPYLCTDLVDVTVDLSALDSKGFWAVAIDFHGQAICARFNSVNPARPWKGRPWKGLPADTWSSSLDKQGFASGVSTIREMIAAGDVYQVNLTRRLSAPLIDPNTNIAALGAALAEGNPAPYAAVLRLPDQNTHIASASPERFLRRDGSRVQSCPIKGTARNPSEFTAKDQAENLMIVDLVRNDLGKVCDYGSVKVPALFSVEHHPGLVHLVSITEGRLTEGNGWPELIAATFPPGSVTGAPKLAALSAIADLEPHNRGVYCGAVGWVDADHQKGDLNVAIRTLWIEEDHLHLGTGGGITYDSKPEDEWQETELKAKRLLAVASGEHITQ